MTTQPGTEMTSSPPIISPQAKNTRVGFGNRDSFELMQRICTAFSRSSLVPKEYQNNVPNCIIAVGMADRIGADPLMVMQNLQVIHGRPSWSAQFLIATANTCGRFDPLQYEFTGKDGTDTWGCKAVTTAKGSGKLLVGPEITIAIAKKEGWYQKAGSKWQTIPQLMLMYRAGAWWVRAYAPELSLGLQTQEEAADIIEATPKTGGGYEVLQQALAQTAKEPPPETTPAPPVETVDADGVVTETPPAALREPPKAAAPKPRVEAPEEPPPAEPEWPEDQSPPFDNGAGGPAPAPAPDAVDADGRIHPGADTLLKNAVAGLSEPDMTSIEVLDDYATRIRQNFQSLIEDDAERMRCFGRFQAELRDAKRKLMMPKRRR